MKKVKINLTKTQKIFISLTTLLIASLSVITLAFFKSTDEVTNRIYSPASPKIMLSEPKWYEEGESLAEQSVPGVVFPKDPYITNISDYDIYIRIKIEILNENQEEITDNNRKKSILESIYCLNDSTDKNSFSKFLTVTVDNDTLNIESDNPNFFYYDGYFYYGNCTDEERLLTSLKPNDVTPTLFDVVITPHDENYTKYFEEDFSIKVSAEAVYTIRNQNGEITETFYEIVERFEGS